MRLCAAQGKLQKHQAFEAEVVANKERIFSAIAMGESKAPLLCLNLHVVSISAALRGDHECMGKEEEVEEVTTTLSTQWDLLLEKMRDKTQKLREANQQQQFNQVSVGRLLHLSHKVIFSDSLPQSVSDLDFWLDGVGAQLSSGDTGRDLGGVQTLLKKQQLVEADIAAHQV